MSSQPQTDVLVTTSPEVIQLSLVLEPSSSAPIDNGIDRQDDAESGKPSFSPDHSNAAFRNLAKEIKKEMVEHTIVLLGRSDAGKTTFIKAVQHAVDAAIPGPPATEAPTSGIVEYDVPLPDGKTLKFVDTPGFDGYEAGGEGAMETEEILRVLEEHLATNGTSVPVSHVLVFLNANDMATTEFKPRARRTFERLFPNAQVACVTTRWDQIEEDEGRQITAEEAQSKEESLYASGISSGSLLEYLHGGRPNREGDILHFRSGLPIEAYSSPLNIMLKLFARPGSDTTLEERLAAVTKERDELAAKYTLLLQEKQAPTAVDDAAPPKEAVRTPRTRQQRLLDTIDRFSAQVFEMVAELEREALDVADECAADRAAFEAASAAIKEAEGRLAESAERVKVAEEDRAHMGQGLDALRELEGSLSKRLDELGMKGARPSVGVWPSVTEQLSSRLEHTQGFISEMEGWKSAAEDYCQKSRQEMEQAAAEMKKWEHIKQGKERELNEWLSPESERLLEERETFQALQETLCTSLDAMRKGLKESWEGKLGGEHLFWERLGDYVVKPEILAHPGDWAPVIESFYETDVTLALTQRMAKLHSTVVQRLKAREDMIKREWKKYVKDIFLLKVLPPPPPPLMGHSDRVWGVAFSWDGMKIVSGSEDKTVRVWDALTGTVQLVLEGHCSTVTSVAFSPDGERIISGSSDKTVRVWDALTGRVERDLVGHTDAVWSVAFSADGSRIVSGSKDKTVRVWDASTGQVQRILEGHTGMVYSVVFSGEGSKIISGSDDKTVRVWDASTGGVHKVLQEENQIESVAVSADGLWIVTGLSNGMVKVWNLLEGRVLRVLKGHSGNARSVALSQDGSWIVSGSYDDTLRVWDASTGTARSVNNGHGSSDVNTVALSRDGRRVASGSDDRTVRLWDMAPLTL
ncbi:hypothetical protein D9611_007943 [Ephemerocybe angulata]|uniref:G domain-containing protein n=1 Tax=Ephemerocybe angulata TaxID=980116 RepID=A0A8H5CGH3_9AGAR|nr:hypothetical protein D9611_007943 [Tulosesus angulatus]